MRDIGKLHEEIGLVVEVLKQVGVYLIFAYFAENVAGQLVFNSFHRLSFKL